ncbi:hypothetical protein PUN28_016044 [Cardiocondyla obscurior]|uniref:Uncharacterized protein n=1 Tax=Cardiocondyla obscurior TaxID=286306 RepID=A0AAW2ETA8_9HYME
MDRKIKKTSLYIAANFSRRDPEQSGRSRDSPEEVTRLFLTSSSLSGGRASVVGLPREYVLRGGGGPGRASGFDGATLRVIKAACCITPSLRIEPQPR